MNSKVALVARGLLGLIFLVFGLNGFLQFMPQPPLPEGAMAFFTGLMAAKYLLPLMAGAQVLCGALLLANKKVPLALLILAPICLNILLFHIFLETSGLPVAVVIIVLGLIVAWDRKEAFRSVLA